MLVWLTQDSKYFKHFHAVFSGEYLEFRSVSSSVGPDETFSSFIAFMKHEAKENWEVALLKALEERG